MEIIRKEIMPFVNLTYIHTEKFKTSSLSLNLLLQLDEATAAKNALLPMVLSRGTANYPSMVQISKKKDDMYGASVGYNNRKKGEIQCLGFGASFLNDNCVPGGESLLGEATAFTCEMLCNPLLENGLLKEAYVESEKRNLIRGIQSKINDKTGFAVSRMTEFMCAGEKYAVDRLGTVSEIEKITAEGLTAHYREILSTAPMEIFYSGGANLETLEAALLTALENLPRTQVNQNLCTEIRTQAGEVRYLTEEMNVSQGVLVMGFRLGECMRDLDRAALLMFGSIYGSGANSKLFANVRGKLSLCYTINAATDTAKGLMTVIAGIAFDKYQMTVDEICAQLENMKNGDISDYEMAVAKSGIKTSIRAMRDTPGALSEYYLGAVIENHIETLEELLVQMDEIDKARVQKLAQSIQLDVVYFLKGKE